MSMLKLSPKPLTYFEEVRLIKWLEEDLGENKKTIQLHKNKEKKSVR